MRRHILLAVGGVTISLATTLLFAVGISFLPLSRDGSVTVSATTGAVVWFLSGFTGSAFASRRAGAEGVGVAASVSGGLILVFLLVNRPTFGEPAALPPTS